MCYNNQGDTMKTNIIYSNDLLHVELEGHILKKDYLKLKKKLEYIVDEYQINGIVIYTKNSYISNDYLEDIKNSFLNTTII